VAAEATDADPAARGPGAGRRPPSGVASGRRGGGAARIGPRIRAGPVLALAGLALVAAAGARWARAEARGPLAAVPVLAGDSAATLLAILRPGDCESYRPLVAAWDRLHRRGDVRVVGAVVDGPEAAAARDSLEERLGVAFPLRHDLGDAAETLALRLGYGATPLSVLLDRRGRPRAAVPPAGGRRGAEAASRVADAHLGLLADEEAAP
jgi:hypothetical protein